MVKPPQPFLALFLHSTMLLNRRNLKKLMLNLTFKIFDFLNRNTTNKFERGLIIKDPIKNILFKIVKMIHRLILVSFLMIHFILE